MLTSVLALRANDSHNSIFWKELDNMRGRKPEPTNIKLARGIEPRRRKHEPKPAPLLVGEPPDLLDDEAAAKWRELAPKLEKLGVLTVADADSLALLCQSWALAQQARRDLDENGMTLPTGKRNPSLLTWRENVALFTRLSALFGLNPSDRTRIGVQRQDDSDDPMELLLRSRGG